MTTHAIYQARRAEVLKRMPQNSVMILAAAPVYIRNYDVEHSYRQDSNFYYLTGFVEPDSVLILSNVHDDQSTLFLRERDPAKEQWDGLRLGVERAPEALGVDKAFSIHSLDAKLLDYMKGTSQLYTQLGIDLEWDRRIHVTQRRAVAQSRHGVIRDCRLPGG